MLLQPRHGVSRHARPSCAQPARWVRPEDSRGIKRPRRGLERLEKAPSPAPQGPSLTSLGSCSSVVIVVMAMLLYFFLASTGTRENPGPRSPEKGCVWTGPGPQLLHPPTMCLPPLPRDEGQGTHEDGTCSSARGEQHYHRKTHRVPRHSDRASKRVPSRSCKRARNI